MPAADGCLSSQNAPTDGDEISPAVCDWVDRRAGPSTCTLGLRMTGHFNCVWQSIQSCARRSAEWAPSTDGNGGSSALTMQITSLRKRKIDWLWSAFDRLVTQITGGWLVHFSEFCALLFNNCFRCIKDKSCLETNCRTSGIERYPSANQKDAMIF